MHDADTPRGRLLRLGAGALTDSELVQLVTGARADALPALEGGLRALLAEPPDNLLESDSLGAAGAARLLAAFELGRRALRAAETRPRLATPEAIYSYARRRLSGLRCEEFHVLCFSSRNVLLRHAKVAQGTVDQCRVDPREVLGPAVACRASGVVLLHNHPSGDSNPSVQDLVVTRQLRDGARLLCIKLLDHLIITDTGFMSLAVQGYLDSDDGEPFATRLQDA